MSELFEGLAYLGNWVYWLAFGVAVLTAVLIRLLPGVSTSLVVAPALPFIVANVEDPLIGIVMLTTLTGAGCGDEVRHPRAVRPAGLCKLRHVPGREPVSAQRTGRPHAWRRLLGLSDRGPRGSARVRFCAPHRRTSRALVTQRFRGHGVRCDSVVRSRDTGVAQFGSDAEGTGGCGVGSAARHERPRPIRGTVALCFRRIGPVAQFLRDRGSHRRPRPGGSDRPDGDPAAAFAPGDTGQQERSLFEASAMGSAGGASPCGRASSAAWSVSCRALARDWCTGSPMRWAYSSRRTRGSSAGDLWTGCSWRNQRWAQAWREEGLQPSCSGYPAAAHGRSSSLPCCRTASLLVLGCWNRTVTSSR